ncbi:DUF5403 family protein [Kitasatospora purpeofusca]|uniref:DUF5403 family protein n=1 Tax=Kitasatospora purpeofusca TaxID=67352 RepID=UPI0037FA8235
MATVKPNTNAVVAHLPEVRAEIAAELERRAERVRAVIAAHVETGALAASLNVEVDRTDSTVSISDPAVISINYGHLAADGSFVPGIHAIEAAMT